MVKKFPFQTMKTLNTLPMQLQVLQLKTSQLFPTQDQATFGSIPAHVTTLPAGTTAPITLRNHQPTQLMVNPLLLHMDLDQSQDLFQEIPPGQEMLSQRTSDLVKLLLLKVFLSMPHRCQVSWDLLMVPSQLITSPPLLIPVILLIRALLSISITTLKPVT